MKLAERVIGFDKPSVWTIMGELATKTKSVNLGQGYPTWSPPQFYLDALADAVLTASHQYSRAYGSLALVQSISRFHMESFGPINSQQEICCTNGAEQGLYCSITAFLDPGDQVIQFSPAYDSYHSQVHMAEGITIGKQFIFRCPSEAKTFPVKGRNLIQAHPDRLFQRSLSPRTKLFILNSPHNPVGKIFTQAELSRLGKILTNYPKVIILEDNVYQRMTFDDSFGRPLPKMCFQPGMRERTVSIYSAGKILAATGMRIGWVIGPSHLIKGVRTVHQYNVFCMNNVIQSAAAKSIDIIADPSSTYLVDFARKLARNRNILLEELAKCKYQFGLWIPKGGYFVLADISKVQIKKTYFFDESGNPRSRDYAFCAQLAHQEKVVAIPCSSFYDKTAIIERQKYIRFAFCKDQSLIREAGKRLASPNVPSGSL